MPLNITMYNIKHGLFVCVCFLDSLQQSWSFLSTFYIHETTTVVRPLYRIICVEILLEQFYCPARMPLLAATSRIRIREKTLRVLLNGVNRTASPYHLQIGGKSCK